jgi:hypothetical protein
MTKMTGSHKKRGKWTFDTVVDATEPFAMLLTKRNRKGAIPRDEDNCVLAKCGYSHGYVTKILNNYAYLAPKSDPRNATRYQISSAAKVGVMQFDKPDGEWPIYADGLHIVLRPVARTSSMSFRRSAEYKAARVEWNKATNARRKKGKVKKIKTQQKSDGITLESWRKGKGYFKRK